MLCADAAVEPASAASRSPSVAPENAPDKTPTSVMPICTVDRKRPGLRAELERAAGAVARSRSIIALRRAGRDETIGSSDIASRPLMR